MTREDADEEALDPETEAAIRAVVRDELDRQRGDSSLRVVGQVLAGVLFALFVLQPVMGISIFALADAGVPIAVLAAGSLVTFVGLVAYGWQLPPFR